MGKNTIDKSWHDHLKKISSKGNKKRWGGKSDEEKKRFMKKVRAGKQIKDGGGE